MKILCFLLSLLCILQIRCHLCRLHSCFSSIQCPINHSKDPKIRNIVILGSGPAGCTAAIYAARAMLKPLVISGYQYGGQLILTSDVENYPGFKDSISGPELMDELIAQATKFGAEFLNIDCNNVDLSCWPFKIHVDDSIIEARSLIIATGATAQWLNATNEEKFKGKTISGCATCDGFMFKNKSVVVIGGGDTAMEEATFLTKFAKNVTLIHRRDSFRASKAMLNRAISNSKIRILTNKRVSQWIGDMSIGFLTGAQLTDTVSGEVSEVKVVF